MADLLVDVEQLVRNALAADTDIAALVDERIGTRIATDPTYPFIVIRRVASRQVARRWLDGVRIQFDCYADTQKEAWTIAATIQAVITRLVGVYPEGIVTGSDEEIGPTYQPDPKTSKPRYIQDHRIYAHP